MWNQIEQSLHQSVERVFTKVAMVVPGILAFVLALIIFLAIAWLAAYLIRWILTAARFDDRLLAGTSRMIEWSPSQTPTLLVSRIVFWAFVLAGVMVGLSAFEAASAESLFAGYLLSYLPRIVGAVLILLVGNVVARFVSRSVLIGAVNMNLQYARLLASGIKWLVLVLFAYPITAFVVGADWGGVARATFIPSMPHTRNEWSTLVAILGTTISPYLFFWQASQEVEEEKSAGQSTLAQRRGATPKELELRNFDVGVGAFFSNMVMFFIILTTAITLNRHGITHIETTRQAAEALRPLAGKFAATLFTVGIVGVGFLAIPTLAGSTAYAFAETLGWRQGLDKDLKQARAFYALILLSTGLGVGLNFVDINPVKALYWTAVINGLLAPFLLVAILIVASDKKLMQGQPSSRLGWIVVAITTVAMFAAGVAMFVV